MVKSLNYPETRIFSAFLEENLSSRAVEPSRRLLDIAMDKEHPRGKNKCFELNVTMLYGEEIHWDGSYSSPYCQTTFFRATGEVSVAFAALGRH